MSRVNYRNLAIGVVLAWGGLTLLVSHEAQADRVYPAGQSPQNRVRALAQPIRIEALGGGLPTGPGRNALHQLVIKVRGRRSGIQGLEKLVVTGYGASQPVWTQFWLLGDEGVRIQSYLEHPGKEGLVEPTQIWIRTRQATVSCPSIPGVCIKTNFGKRAPLGVRLGEGNVWPRGWSIRAPSSPWQIQSVTDWLEPGGARKHFTITRKYHVSVRFEPFALVAMKQRSQFDRLEITVDPDTGIPLRTVAKAGEHRTIWERTISDVIRIPLDQSESFLEIPLERKVKEVEAKNKGPDPVDQVSGDSFQDPLGGSSSSRP